MLQLSIRASKLCVKSIYGGFIHHSKIVLQEFVLTSFLAFSAILNDFSKIEFSPEALTLGFNQARFLRAKTLQYTLWQSFSWSIFSVFFLNGEHCAYLPEIINALLDCQKKHTERRELPSVVTYLVVVVQQYRVSSF